LTSPDRRDASVSATSADFLLTAPSLLPAYGRYRAMKVRQLIRALAKHDLDMEVVIPAGADLPGAFMAVDGVEEDRFALDRQEPVHLRLAELRSEEMLVAVRLTARPPAASH
jgi:hypothetical protein